MKRGRGRPPKTPSYSPKSFLHRGSENQHGGRSSPQAAFSVRMKTRNQGKPLSQQFYIGNSSESDSDSDSVSSYASSHTSTKIAKKRFVEELKQVTPVNLPPSSDDLPIPHEHVIQTVAIYEILRHFGRILRLSPFRFEDFCAAVQAPEQSALLAQVHISLLRTLLSEDEANGLTFGANDEKDSLNIYFYSLDTFTWPDQIRAYIASDKNEFGDIENAVVDYTGHNPFPFTTIANRLRVLQRLCDQFLSSNAVRDDIMNEGMTESEDHCRNCSKMGDLLCCEICPAVYHLHCLKPPLENVPEGDWLCPVCEMHRLKGVTDCPVSWNRDGWLRNTPLGIDREGRKYWFLARRVFV